VRPTFPKTLREFRDRFADERACVGYLWEDFHGSKPAYDRRKKTYGSFPNTLGPDYPNVLVFL
jgi:hypothetical protein